MSRFKVKSEPGQGDDAEETAVLQLGEAEGGGFGTCADIEKVKPEPFADDATVSRHSVLEVLLFAFECIYILLNVRLFIKDKIMIYILSHFNLFHF